MGEAVESPGDAHFAAHMAAVTPEAEVIASSRLDADVAIAFDDDDEGPDAETNNDTGAASPRGGDGGDGGDSDGSGDGAAAGSATPAAPATGEAADGDDDGDGDGDSDSDGDGGDGGGAAHPADTPDDVAHDDDTPETITMDNYRSMLLNFEVFNSGFWATEDLEAQRMHSQRSIFFGRQIMGFVAGMLLFETSELRNASQAELSLHHAALLAPAALVRYVAHCVPAVAAENAGVPDTEIANAYQSWVFNVLIEFGVTLAIDIGFDCVTWIMQNGAALTLRGGAGEGGDAAATAAGDVIEFLNSLPSANGTAVRSGPPAATGTATASPGATTTNATNATTTTTTTAAAAAAVPAAAKAPLEKLVSDASRRSGHRFSSPPHLRWDDFFGLDTKPKATWFGSRCQTCQTIIVVGRKTVVVGAEKCPGAKHARQWRTDFLASCRRVHRHQRYLSSDMPFFASLGIRKAVTLLRLDQPAIVNQLCPHGYYWRHVVCGGDDAENDANAGDAAAANAAASAPCGQWAGCTVGRPCRRRWAVGLCEEPTCKEELDERGVVMRTPAGGVTGVTGVTTTAAAAAGRDGGVGDAAAGGELPAAVTASLEAMKRKRAEISDPRALSASERALLLSGTAGDVNAPGEAAKRMRIARQAPLAALLSTAALVGAAEAAGGKQRALGDDAGAATPTTQVAAATSLASAIAAKDDWLGPAAFTPAERSSHRPAIAVRGSVSGNVTKSDSVAKSTSAVATSEKLVRVVSSSSATASVTAASRANADVPSTKRVLGRAIGVAGLFAGASSAKAAAAAASARLAAAAAPATTAIATSAGVVTANTQRSCPASIAATGTRGVVRAATVQRLRVTPVAATSAVAHKLERDENGDDNDDNDNDDDDNENVNDDNEGDGGGDDDENESDGGGDEELGDDDASGEEDAGNDDRLGSEANENDDDEDALVSPVLDAACRSTGLLASGSIRRPSVPMRFDDDDDVADDDVDNGDEGGGNVHGESAGDGGDDADAGDGGQHAGGSADRSGTEYEDIASDDRYMEYLDEFGGENERGDEDDGDADSQHVMPSAPPPLPRSVHETAATMTTTTTTTAPTVRSKSAAAAAAAAAATAAAVVAAPRAKAAAAASAAASASAKPAPIERQIACGVARGRCKARPECDCPMYLRLLQNSMMDAGSCAQCGHFPAIHEKL